MSSKNDNEYLLIDAGVMEGGQLIFATKHIISNVDAKFGDVVQSILEELAQVQIDADRNHSQFYNRTNDTIKQKAGEMFGRVESISCRNNTMHIELIKFLHETNIKIKSLNSNQTPLFENGISIQLASLPYIAMDRKRPYAATEEQNFNIDPAMTGDYNMMNYEPHPFRRNAGDSTTDIYGPRTRTDTNGFGLARVPSPPPVHIPPPPNLPPADIEHNNAGGKCAVHPSKPSIRNRQRCSSEGCTNYALQGRVCARHGAKLRRCSVEGCTKKSQKGGLCCRHGANATLPKCRVQGCSHITKRGGYCGRHGDKCSHDGCGNVITRQGKCDKHHGNLIKKRICDHHECTNRAKKGGVCNKHGAAQQRYVCSHEGCKIRTKKGELCTKHGAEFEAALHVAQSKQCSHNPTSSSPPQTSG